MESRPSDFSSSSSSPIMDQGGESPVGSPRQQGKQRRRTITPISSENWKSGAFEKHAMITIICPSAHQSQLLADYISSVRQTTMVPTFRCHSLWLRDIALRSDTSACLNWALRAISIAHLGRKASDPDLIETSRRTYGKALLKLNSALQDPFEGLSSDTLSATILLSFYEIFNCTDRHSWIKHAGGAGHLIRLRGPARHRTGIDRTVFMACRYSLIMEAFQNRNPCFLDAPEWRALCRDINEDLKRENPNSPLLDGNEQFFQEIVQHPAYLSSALDAVSVPQPDPVRLKALFASGQSHRTKYQAIHARVTHELRAMGREPTKTASSFNDTTFPVVYEYTDAHIASLFCGYWTVLCAINISLIGLQGKIAQVEQLKRQAHHYVRHHEPDIFSASSDYPNPLPHPPNPISSTSTIRERGRPLWEIAVNQGSSHLYIAENTAYAREICKSVEYLQHTPFVGPLFLVLALRMALRMGIMKKEKQWILQKLDQIGVDMGLARTEVEAYRYQRGATNETGDGMEAPPWWAPPGTKNPSAYWGMKNEPALEKRECDGKGMMAFVENDVLGKNVGSGIEMPAMGVMIPRDDRDEDDGGRGLDHASPPNDEDTLPRWDPSPLNPTLMASETVTEGTIDPGGSGWGEPVSSGYMLGKGLVAESSPVGSEGVFQDL